ncbi:MAG: hypothetical protein COB39_12670 [Marinosulfonomonas sp.]|nr:MAG: hypothetical protein COB39_12670 [Marinosulfonomonas sp.]
MLDGGAVEDQPVVGGLDVHKKTYSAALFSKEDGLIESYTCRLGKDKQVCPAILINNRCDKGCRAQFTAMLGPGFMFTTPKIFIAPYIALL